MCPDGNTCMTYVAVRNERACLGMTEILPGSTPSRPRRLNAVHAMTPLCTAQAHALFVAHHRTTPRGTCLPCDAVTARAGACRKLDYKSFPAGHRATTTLYTGRKRSW